MRRLYKILPLYIIWSTILYFFIKYFDPIVGESEKFSLWQALILGKADYHLYFVPKLFQLYLLFPFLFDLIRRFNLKILIPIFILQIAAFLVIGKHVENLKPDLTWGDQYTYIYFWNWIFYFVLGIYLTRITNPKSIYKYLLILASIFTLDWLIENSFSMVRTGVDIIAITRFTQVPTLFFATCVILFLILWGKRLNSLPDRLKRILVQMGRDSFVVYLLHTIIIRLLFSVWKIPISNNFFLYSISVIVLSFLFARLFNLLLNKLPIKLT